MASVSEQACTILAAVSTQLRIKQVLDQLPEPLHDRMFS